METVIKRKKCKMVGSMETVIKNYVNYKFELMYNGQIKYD